MKAALQHAATIKVRVFRNLTRHCYSIQAVLPQMGWRTLAHAEHVLLTDTRFIVSQAARQRVLRTRKRTVYAAIQGDLEPWSGCFAKTFDDPTAESLIRLASECLTDARFDHRVRYNLWNTGVFELASMNATTWRPASHCAAVSCAPSGVVAKVR